MEQLDQSKNPKSGQISYSEGWSSSLSSPRATWDHVTTSIFIFYFFSFLGMVMTSIGHPYALTFLILLLIYLLYHFAYSLKL